MGFLIIFFSSEYTPFRTTLLVTQHIGHQKQFMELPTNDI